jgi:hypothetical protein
MGPLDGLLRPRVVQGRGLVVAEISRLSVMSGLSVMIRLSFMSRMPRVGFGKVPATQIGTRHGVPAGSMPGRPGACRCV